MNKPAFKPDECLARCLAARRALERRYKTREAFNEFLFELEQQPLTPPRAARASRRGKKRTHGNVRSTARSATAPDCP